MNIEEIEGFLQTGLSFVQKAAPIIGSFTGPTGTLIGTAVGAIAGAADALVTEATSDASIIASGNLANIQDLNATLQQQNAQLATQIADL